MSDPYCSESADLQDVLTLFHPEIRGWFLETMGKPTEIQQKAWPVIASGKHAFITAATGSGKTLTAFLHGLNQLITGQWQINQPQLLYISPLKALNHDIQCNLFEPLTQLQERFKNRGLAFPNIRVQTRSGDTPQSERRQMIRKPPAVLITTPESLHLMLSSKSGRTLLTDIKSVILDEIHAVVDNQRGTLLMTAVERLTLLAGEFQRIALSATVKPVNEAALFIAGYQRTQLNPPAYTPRPVEVVSSHQKKTYDIKICFPSHGTDPEFTESFWKPLVHDFKEVISQNEATLFFVNSRRLSETITLKINADEPVPTAYAHHGSLSREIRHDVEKRLKTGQLKAIVATQSLELGIDIGTLDEVVLIQSPNSVASAIQRIGRAGHGVGQVSKARFFPTHDHDFLTAAVLAEAVIDGDIESVSPLKNPLDVLAQVIIAMTGVEAWPIDELYAAICQCYAYHHLSRSLFDLVIEMLLGRYENTRIRELSPRLLLDREHNVAEARKGALLSLYSSGGTIPDRGYFHLKHRTSGSRIGELDEEFVWEAKKGQVFSLGTQNWRIEEITHNDVWVSPIRSGNKAAPFWIGEEFYRGSHFSRRIADFLKKADAIAETEAFEQYLTTACRMMPAAADQVIQYLKRQKEMTGCPLPHRHHIVMESVQTGPGGVPGNQIVLHTFWGGRVNKPFAVALDTAWQARYGYSLEIYPGNDAIVIVLPEPISSRNLFSLVTPDNVDILLRKGLEGSAFFGARFRESAGRALLVTRKQFNQRMPLWMIRLRSRKLMEAVFALEDFPILLEAWRICLQDEFDMNRLKELLEEIENGTIQISSAAPQRLSPMAREISWRQINQYMYADDAQTSGDVSALRSDLIEEAARTANQRPAVSRETIAVFEEKRQRLYAGYTPSSLLDLLSWIEERICLPEDEWHLLKAAMHRDHGDAAAHWFAEAAGRVCRFRTLSMNHVCFAMPFQMIRLQQGLYKNQQIIIESSGSPVSSETAVDENTGLSVLLEWMRFYGPRTAGWMAEQLGLTVSDLALYVEDAVDMQAWIADALIQGVDDIQICDLENYESLLRLSRARARPAFEALPLDRLPLFLAWHQQLIPRQKDRPLVDALDQLSGFSAPAGLWESQFLPARFPAYQTAAMDEIVRDGLIGWRGSGNQKITFCSADIGPLFADWEKAMAETDSLYTVFQNEMARYDYSALLQLTDLSPAELTHALWHGVWQGQLQNDSFTALRRGLIQKFSMPSVVQPGKNGRMGRARFRQWQQSMPASGNWFLVPVSSGDDSPMQADEMNKERARLLLYRYGILFRELLQKESPLLQWKQIFRALRLMELSGEVLAGYFFENIPGPQFITPGIFQKLTQSWPETDIFWINAADPVSCCGLGLDGFKGQLPARMNSTHLVYQGSRLIVISRKNGKALEIRLSVDDSRLPEALGFLNVMLTRAFNPMSKIMIESINGHDAAGSEYEPVFRNCFDCQVDFKKLILYRPV